MKANFDDILKKRWEEKQFPVDESHRAEMLELLNRQKRRRVFPFWWLGGLVVLMSVAGYLFLNDRSTPVHTNQQQTESNLSSAYAANQENPTQEITDQKSIASVNAPAENSVLPSQTSHSH